MTKYIRKLRVWNVKKRNNSKKNKNGDEMQGEGRYSQEKRKLNIKFKG